LVELELFGGAEAFCEAKNGMELQKLRRGAHPPHRHSGIPLTVIPEKAGIQFQYVVRSTQNVLCPSDACSNWIPAFAGMTVSRTEHLFAREGRRSVSIRVP
jgi:hypothetical protein